MNQTAEADVWLHGGKGAALMRLKAGGFPVPAFLVLTTEELSAGFGEMQAQALKVTLAKAFKENTLFAVRSSATVEDGAAASFAGQFESVLNVPLAGVPAAIQSVLDSAKGARAAVYRQSSGQDKSAIGMAVIIQEMVAADAAGVGFGIHPLTGDADTCVINAVRGLGEGLVGGEQNSDAYEVRDGNISHRHLIGEKVILSDEDILQTASILRALEDFFGAPQDIEFAFRDGAFYLLQSRPVTAFSKNEAGTKIVWDNSNIVESYPGLTSPLTFSFIEKMYAAVYRQFSLVLGVSKKKVARNEAVYNSMLGLLNGHVYYNLNSWYAALAQLPGYSINASYMEGMMGVKDKPDIDLPQPSKAGIRDYVDVLSAVRAVLGNLRRARKERLKFVAGFDAVYKDYSTKDFSAQSTAQTWQDYLRFEELMVTQWKAPLVNDFFAMIYFGLLKKLCSKHFPGNADLHNQLLSASNDIITTEPIKQLPRLAKLLADDAALSKRVREEDAAALWQALPGHFPTVYQQIADYIETWGERCMEELKLETITYREAPEKLIEVLQGYVRNQIFSYKTAEAETGKRNAAEGEVQQYFRGKPLARLLFNHVLKNARYFVSNRENLRYYRTRGFGMVRRMMLGIGEQAAKNGWLGSPRDIFYLKLPEVERLAGGDLQQQEVIAPRRKDYEVYESLSLPERVTTQGTPPPFLLLPKQASGQTGMRTELIGTACSAGVVRARVKLVTSTASHTSLDGSILCTYATDPGYVVLFPSAAGILTERGSLLSHAAIVSREMGIPCIVGIEGLMARLKDGDEVLMDGSTGVIKILTA